MTRSRSRLLDIANIGTVVPFDYAGLGDADLEARARMAAGKIRNLQQGAILDVGRELLAMKEALPHGQFDEWVKAELNWSKSTALNFMRVAKEFGDKYVTVAYLPPAVQYRLASPSTPDVVRETVTQVKEGQQISVAAVKGMISEARNANSKKKRRAWQKEQEAEAERKTGLKREQRWEAERAKDRAEAKARDERTQHAVDVAVRLLSPADASDLAELQKALSDDIRDWDFVRFLRSSLQRVAFGDRSVFHSDAAESQDRLN